MLTDIDTLSNAGVHFGYPRARRHPSAAPYIYVTRDRTDIFNLEETKRRLDLAVEFAASVSRAGGQILFVSGKEESLDIVKRAAERVGAPFACGRWIGGTLTNFKNIKKRIDRLERLMSERESGELEKYTKRERLLIDRDIEELTVRFGGLTNLAKEPAALFVVDTRYEDTAVREANQLGIPVIGVANSDCDFSLLKFPIPANDTSIQSVRFIVDKIAGGIAEGKKASAAPKQRSEKTAA